MGRFEIAVLERKGEPFDAAAQRTLDIVASSVHALKLPLRLHAAADPLSSCNRVLVYGKDSDQQAYHIAERNLFSRTVGSPSYEEPGAPGVFWVTDIAELDDLDDDSFDAIMVFNVTSSIPFRVVFPQLQRVLRPGGVFAGTGVFRGLHKSKRPLCGVETDFALIDFRNFVEDSGFFVSVAMDLSMEGDVLLAVEEDAKTNEYFSESLKAEGLICTRFLATKLEGESSGVRPSAALRASLPQDGEISPLELSVSDPEISHDPVVITGVSLGLPNELRHDCSVFDQRNFERVFGGENCISQLTLDQKQRILDQNIVQVLKVDGQRVKKRLSKPSEVIGLAARLGKFDLFKEYGVPSQIVETLDITYQLAIAAGLEALNSAGINVLKRGAVNDDGSISPPSVNALPESMQAETGVIFASSFPCTESCVEEISLSSSYHATQLLAECKAIRDAAEAESAKTGQPVLPNYEFDRKLLFKLLVMANTQLAELIKARGPNTHVNAACAGTTQAVAIAHDWIRMQRCKRVVVISADNATSDNLLPYIGTGFLALTAASIASTVETGALPFDKRRNGMILGMGAVGLVLESSSAALGRSARPMAELAGSHFLNSAFHASLLDREHISQELKVFIDRYEASSGVSRHELAKNLVYFSHETCTSAQGGCAKAEMDALTLAFGASRSQILIANTKGFTGHPMGVGLEDAIAVASLDMGLVPPIANYKERDPCLGDIMLSQGGAHNRTYALRFGAGFGSQFVFLLFKKWSAECLNPYQHGLQTHTGLSHELEMYDDLDTDCSALKGEDHVNGQAGEHEYDDDEVATSKVQRYLRHMGHRPCSVNEVAEPLGGDDQQAGAMDEIDDDSRKQMMRLMGYVEEYPYAAQQAGQEQRAASPTRLSARLASADVKDSCSVM